MLKFTKGDAIRTTYQYSQAGRIVRYEPIPSRCNPGTVMEWVHRAVRRWLQGLRPCRHDEQG